MRAIVMLVAFSMSAMTANAQMFPNAPWNKAKAGSCTSGTCGAMQSVTEVPVESTQKSVAAKSGLLRDAAYYDVVRLYLKKAKPGVNTSLATNAIIDAASTNVPTTFTPKAGGTILAELIAFLNSPAGQQLIAELLALIASGG